VDSGWREFVLPGWWRKGVKMPLTDDGRNILNWRKAERSLNHGACAEVANGSGIIVMRDSKDPNGPVLFYSAASWRSFIAAAKLGGACLPAMS
jgi:hypothetical protein